MLAKHVIFDVMGHAVIINKLKKKTIQRLLLVATVAQLFLV